MQSNLNVNLPTFISFRPSGKDFEVSLNFEAIGMIAPYGEDGKSTQFFYLHDLGVSWVVDTPYTEVMRDVHLATASNNLRSPQERG